MVVLKNHVSLNMTDLKKSDFKAEDYDAVISLCGCGVNLPQEWVLRDVFQDWQLDDPEGQPLETYRRVRDEIKQRIEMLPLFLTPSKV